MASGCVSPCARALCSRDARHPSTGGCRSGCAGSWSGWANGSNPSSTRTGSCCWSCCTRSCCCNFVGRHHHHLRHHHHHVFLHVCPDPEISSASMGRSTRPHAAKSPPEWHADGGALTDRHPRTGACGATAAPGSDGSCRTHPPRTGVHRDRPHHRQRRPAGTLTSGQDNRNRAVPLQGVFQGRQV